VTPPWHSLELPLVTSELWSLAVGRGFHCDGATWAPDIIAGIRIGLRGTDYRPDLPANMHDLRYWMARNHDSLVTAASDVIQGQFWWTRAAWRAANRELYYGMQSRLAELEGFFGWTQRGWPWIYWVGVSGPAGWRCWTVHHAKSPRQLRAAK
jgi:hypothetical protein